MKGMRVKLTFTFSAVGTCVPLFVSVCGLTERELPEEECVILDIEGLCVGGGGVNVGCNTKGYLVLMRGGSANEGADKKRYKYYRDNILLPFISETRKTYDQFDDTDDKNIPNNLTAAGWCDGDLAQIASIVNDIEKFCEHKVVANKQAASRSGTEQAADLTKCFKMIRKLQGVYTVSHLPAHLHPLKRAIQTAFDDLFREGQVRLLTLKRRAFVDFLSNIPAMSTRAITRENI